MTARKVYRGAICLAMAAGTVHAALLDYEGFNYTGVAIADQNGGTGWGGAWVNTTGDPRLTDDGVSLDSPAFPFTPVGSRLVRIPPQDGAAADRAAVRNLSQSFNLAEDGHILYASTLVRRGADGDATAGSDIQFQFRTSGGTIGFRFGVSATDVFFVGINAVETGGGAVPVLPDTTYFLVAKFVSSSAAGGDQAMLKVYGPGDTVPATEPAAWDIVATGSRSDLVSQLRLNMGYRNSYGEIDEIRIGDDWSSVPEPATLATMGMAALVLVRRRK